MLVGSSQQEIKDSGFVIFGTCQQSVPLILTELMLLNRFVPVSFIFTASDGIPTQCIQFRIAQMSGHIVTYMKVITTQRS
ncbi:unnamed protein product [Schistosoma margrebowiei]|uniref:Uncharacterized protein n=1 Tax=Schistosoma margrebowiei TaxID=48269 RepID=A0A183M307_9TREM|nr:unnamed protein product [Schistosoma margrebowiei]